MSYSTEWAWAAGFLDGDGNFASTRVHIVERKYGSGLRIKAYPYFKIQVVQTNPRVLKRLQKLLGGSVAGPYGPYKSSRSKPYYQFHLANAEKAFSKLRPYLSPMKQRQGDAALKLLKTRMSEARSKCHRLE